MQPLVSTATDIGDLRQSSTAEDGPQDDPILQAATPPTSSSTDTPFGDSMFDDPSTFTSAATSAFGDNFLDDPLAASSSRPEPEHTVEDDTYPDDAASKPFGDSLFDSLEFPHGDNGDFHFGASALDADEPPFAEESRRSPLGTFAQNLSNEDEDSLPSFQDLFPFPAAASSSLPRAPRFGSSPLSSISARSFSGKLVLFPRRAKTSDASTSRTPHSRDVSKLLSVPMHRMIQNISMAPKTSRTPASPTTVTDLSKPAPPTAKDMWVDKYRPKRFTDLVGDESVHRSTLAWLKEWDPCVFKRRPTNHVKRKRDREAKEATTDEPSRAPDEWGRPHEKILLLAGPPGLGKTTLAHVVAAAAGYNVLEINASDARTGNIIDERIKPALETGQGLGRSKPVLVVVDEVDGATGENSSSFVAKLVQLTIDGKRKRLKSGEQRNPKDKRPLLRPIICICNDLWAPSIGKLRAIARVVRFQPAAPAQLVKRLREICDTEMLQANTRALGLLVGIAKGDFRGCLNTLQMIHIRRQEVTETVVRHATVGMKESETTTQAVWNDIFLPLSKKRIKDAGMPIEEKEKYVNRLARLLEASGTIDKVMLGCFAHYATLHHQDPSWTRYTNAHKWFSAFDLFNSTMRSEQEYAVLGYLPYFVVPIHPLFVDSGNAKVGNPRDDWECFVKTKASEEIYRSLSASVVSDHGRHTASFRHLLNKEVVVAEFAPILNRLISPPLRPVNSQIIRPQEKAMLKKLVNVMVSLELRFVQEKGEDGQLMYRLDPPIDIFVTYEGKRAADIAPSKYAVRHMVAAEIEAEYAARHAEAVDKTEGRKASTFFRRKKVAAPVPEEDEADAPPPPEGEETITQVAAEAREALAKKKADKKIDIADRPPVDFFGRPIKRKEPEVAKNAPAVTGPPTKKFKVTYRYNEGASAAVRMPVKMSALL